MRALYFLFLLLVGLGNTAFIEKTIDFGEGETLTMRVDGLEETKPENDEDREIKDKRLQDIEAANAKLSKEEEDEAKKQDLADVKKNYLFSIDGYKPENVPDHLDHDCENVRDFVKDYKKSADNQTTGLKPQHINRNYKFHARLENGKVTKYNSAYGIPVFGQPHFSDAAMKRACYLVRYIFADNEGMRRMAYHGQMFIYGQKGGFMTPSSPNVGNSGLSCPCSVKVPFPQRQIYTPAHEFAHWFLKLAIPNMAELGYFKAPAFLNNPQWSFKKDHKPCCKEDVSQCDPRRNVYTNNAFYDFLYNALKQDTLTPHYSAKFNFNRPKSTSINACNTHHYFIYTGQDKFLGLESGGNAKKLQREFLKGKNENLFNLLNTIWPCDNTYTSVCEDAAYDFKKGSNQRLTIGKSAKNDLSLMICDKTIDEAKNPIKLKPAELEKLIKGIADDDIEDDIDAIAKEWYVENGKDIWRNENHGKTIAEKCKMILRKGTWPLDPWLKEDANLWEMDVESLHAALNDSNERAWWLRKCCATTARFNGKLEKKWSVEEDLKNEGKHCWEQCNKKGHCPEFCGADGFCCRQGIKEKNGENIGCDGIVGGNGQRICVGRKYLTGST